MLLGKGLLDTYYFSWVYGNFCAKGDKYYNNMNLLI